MFKFSAVLEIRLSERDSSGTTEPPKAAKVMERIARREERSDEAARPILN
jgi:hypothetical protein